MPNSEKGQLSMNDLIKLFIKDSDPKKLNLTIGVCMGEDKKTYKFDIVKEVSQMLIQSEDFNHGYLNLSGHNELALLAKDFVFGENCRAIQEDRIHAFQTVGGAGALNLGAFLAKNNFSKKKIYVSNPTWNPHYHIMESIFDEILQYRFYDCQQQVVDFEGMLDDLTNAEPYSAVLLQASCHNPTGGHLSKIQWENIMNLMKEKNLFPYFDFAYQGFGVDFETDSFPLRLFDESGFEFLVAQTFSKNFGIYGERLGFIFTVLKDSSELSNIHSMLENYVSKSYAIPPAFPAKIVYEILKNKDFKARWIEEFLQLKERLSNIRVALLKSLEGKLPGRNFDFITNNDGLFIQLNFKGDEGRILRDKYHVYVLEDGRVNLSGLSLNDIEYFTDALASII